MRIGQKIQIERNRQNLTLDKLAKMVGNVSKATLSRIENSEGQKYEPSFNLIVKISHVLGVPLDTFAYDVKSEAEIINETFDEIITYSRVKGIFKSKLQEINDLLLKKAIMSLGPLKELMTQVRGGLFRVIEIKSKKEISMQGEAVQSWEVELKALADDLCYYRHRYMRSEENPYHRYDNFIIEKGIEINFNGETKLKPPAFMAKESRFVFFNVPFPKPINRGQKIQLKWREEYNNAHVMKKSLLPKESIFSERTGYFILYSPTEFLQKEIIFPEEFKIAESDVFPDVKKRVFDNRFSNYEEIERIKKQGLFTTKIIDGRLCARLCVRNPKPGSAYYIRWKIPD